VRLGAAQAQGGLVLLTPTEVKPSTIAGLGLFSRITLKIGTVVWSWDERLDRVITRETASTLPREAVEFLEKYSTLRPSGYCCCGDNAQFINHSDNPNLAYDAFGRVIAARAIASGEELTENYAVLGEVPSLGGADGTGSFT
jgi:SET domain-containing protein